MEDKLSQILSSPESLQKIAEIAKGLAGSGFAGQNADSEEQTGSEKTPEGTEENSGSRESSEETAAAPAASIPSAVLPDIGGLINGLNISPDFMKSIGKAAEGFSNNERRITLLNAFKPFSHGNNTETINRAILALKIARAARLFMSSQ